jgi:hypothetical protein
MAHTDKPPKLSPAALRAWYRHEWYHNLKIPLCYGLLLGAGSVAWTTASGWVAGLMYRARGYLGMSIVTCMPDCTQGVLFTCRSQDLI